MGKNVGLTYVKEFSFPKEQGFSGSAGVHQVRGYQRGGRVKKAKGGAVHDALKSEGAKMGYAYGGSVKNTSAEFKQKRAKQKTMDYGVQPARKGRTQQEIEAGGTKRLKPGFKKGGGVCRVRMAKGTTRAKKGGLAKYAQGGVAKKAGAAQ